MSVLFNDSYYIYIYIYILDYINLRNVHHNKENNLFLPPSLASLLSLSLSIYLSIYPNTVRFSISTEMAIVYQRITCFSPMPVQVFPAYTFFFC